MMMTCWIGVTNAVVAGPLDPLAVRETMVNATTSETTNANVVARRMPDPPKITDFRRCLKSVRVIWGRERYANGVIWKSPGHALARGVTAARLTLDQLVLVRIQAGQPSNTHERVLIRCCRSPGTASARPANAALHGSRTRCRAHATRPPSRGRSAVNRASRRSAGSTADVRGTGLPRSARTRRS